MGFVNKMDRQGSDFLNVCKQIKDYVKIQRSSYCHYLLVKKMNFKGVVDLVKNQAIDWNEDKMGCNI